jgi:phosphatidate cytidylyltransferase
MRELIVRGVSGIFYVSILIVSMYFSETAFLILFFLLGLIALREFSKLLRLRTIALYIVYAVLFYFFSYKQYDFNGVKLLLILTGFVNLFLFKDLLVVSMIPMYGQKKYAVSIFYLISGFLCITLIPFYEGNFNPMPIVAAFILIWVNDTFAFLVGKNFGKRKLLERISPKKTIEGFLGGLLACCIAGFIIFKLAKMYTPSFWIGLALIACVFGTIGDLIQSKFKRQAGVKDSGTLMPGHGGLYDRLDSIIYAAPFIYIYLLLTDYVS